MQLYEFIISPVNMKDITKLFRVLSDESRLRVLNLLLERECCVCEVMQALDISQSKASRILNALYDVGVLELHKEGLWSLYSIDWDGMGTQVKEIIKATTLSLEGNESTVTDRERLRKAERVGPGCVKKIRSEKAASDFQT
jgi:ArsR family transcriptional regulator